MGLRLSSRLLMSLVCLLLIGGCLPREGPPPLPTLSLPQTDQPETAVPSHTPSSAPGTLAASPTLEVETATETPSPTASTPSVTPTTISGVPVFSHVIIVVMENKEFGMVIGNNQMPVFNQWAEEYTLLTQHFAVRHPSLPNYIALIGGNTFGIDSNCTNCTIDARSLPDLIEASGRTWRTYQESMPEPCFEGSSGQYAQKHNPFIYFDPIRNDPERCERGIVPLTQLSADLESGNLPDFIFITPNMCRSAHDCSLLEADGFLREWVEPLIDSPTLGETSLIILTWDEGQGNHGCCGLATGGGRVATVLISPLVKSGFEDDTPYTHYSILKTISESWGLDLLGYAADPQTATIVDPWR